MPRYIDADVLFEKMESAKWYDNLDRDEIAEELLCAQPDADVEPVIHAHWIHTSNKPYVNAGLKCSHCKARISYSERMGGNHLYCYKCGAHMDEQEKT